MKFNFFLLYILFSYSLLAQQFKSAEGQVTFFSDAAIEDISAINKGASSIFDLSNGEIVFLITIMDFTFDKSLMQEHFNEKYMESDKFPRATFKGKVTGFDMTVPGVQQVSAKGMLTIHGRSKEIDVKGSIEKQASLLLLKSAFMVELEDFKIKIPKLLWQNIAERVEVKVDFTYKTI
ncbi:MAG TPA: YceI family protein [Cyclobacteriaceae bacterium]